MNVNVAPQGLAGALPVCPGHVIEVEDLVKRFGDNAPVLDGISLAVAPGSAVAVIGANGAGKSTFVRCLVRLVEPTSGRAIVLGEDLSRLHGRALRRLRSRVGFVFQKHNLVTRLSALSNVVHGVQSRAKGPRTWHQALARTAVRDEAMTCLERVGLGHKALARVDSLSGGQAQRVAVARMLMQRPALVVADEPDASLDPKAGQQVMELLHGLTRELGLSLLFISHRMDHAVAYAERIVGLAGGRVKLDVPAASADPLDLRAFFDT